MNFNDIAEQLRSYDYTTVSISAIIVSLIAVIAMWRLFQKAGRHGWAAIVPFYNMYTMFDIAWGNGWKFLLLLIPIVNIVVAIMNCFKLAKAYGKGVGFGFGLLLLNSVFMLILAFGNAQYVAHVPEAGSNADVQTQSQDNA